MRLFLDSANLQEIDDCLRRGFISGITTNPTVIANSGASGLYSHITQVISKLQDYDLKLPLSVELTSTGEMAMLTEAKHLYDEFGHYEGLVIKVPIGWNELKVIRQLHYDGIPVNCTCCMSTNQAVAAALAGAEYVSIFWGRIRDTGYDAALVVEDTHQLLANSSAQIIVGSIRQMIDINNALLSGADIVTVPYKFLQQMCQHPKTDEAVGQFLRDAQALQHG